jgi:hypothetical protein
MVTLRQELANRGIRYASKLDTQKAEDIVFDTSVELCEALGYIAKCISHLDGEYPEDKAEISDWNMPIKDGITSGGNKKKWGREYRVYMRTKNNCPQKISERLHRDSYNRFGGGLFVEALLLCGFRSGHSQNISTIQNTVFNIFTDPAEQAAFINGYNLVP